MSDEPRYQTGYRPIDEHKKPSFETIPNAPPPPDFASLELYRDASDVITRFERDFFRERWFGTDEGLIPFAWEAVKTLDEHEPDPALRIKALPRELYLLDHFNNILNEETYVVLKSRQIMITWSTFIYITWECLRQPYRKIGLFPKKSDDGKDHIEDRIQATIFQHLPKWLRDDFPEPELNRGIFHLKHKRGRAEIWNSWIASFEKGEHQARQYTLSELFFDEMAYQEKAEKAWQASMPTGMGRKKGRMAKVIAASTMVPGSFHDALCGDNITVDNAVEISLGNLPVPPSGFYKNPLPGVVHYRNTKYNALVAVYSFFADSEKRDPLWEAEKAVRYGGASNPKWLLEFRMQRQAFRGVMVYPHWSRDWNVIPAREVNRECEIFLSLDFGHTVPTAVLFWEWNEHEQTLICFDEIYLTTTAVGVMKSFIAMQLAIRLRLPLDEVLFSEILGHNVGDPASPGTMLEYAQSPNPLYITGNPTPDAGQRAWKINDRATGEARLDTAFRPAFTCCGIRQYAMDGKTIGTCEAVNVDEAMQKKKCGKEHAARPTVMFMEGRAPHTESEIPKQQRIDQQDPGLEAPERNRKGVPDHGTDSARMACMRYPNFMGIEPGEAPVPRFLKVPVHLLSTKDAFWRERHELIVDQVQQREAFAEVGEIGYADDDEEDTDDSDA